MRAGSSAATGRAISSATMINSFFISGFLAAEREELERALVHVDPETRPVRRRHQSILRLQRRAENLRAQRIVRRVELHDDRVLERGREVQARGERDAVAPGVQRDGQAMRIRERGDAHDLADAAGARDVGLENIHGRPRDELLEVVDGMEILAERDGNFRGCFQLRVARRVGEEHRLLEPADAELGERLDRALGGREIVAHVGVAHERELGTDGLAHRAHALDVARDIEADLHLDAAVAQLRQRQRALDDFLDIVRVERGRVDLDARARLVAQQLIYGSAFGFAADVPQRTVQARERDEADAAEPELTRARAEVELLPDAIDIGRVHAHDGGLDDLLDDELDDRAVARARAEAVDAGVGLDADERGRARFPDAAPARHLAFGGDRRAEADRADVGDLHGSSAEILVILVVVAVVILGRRGLDDEELPPLDQARRVGRHVFPDRDTAQAAHDLLPFLREDEVDEELPGGRMRLLGGDADDDRIDEVRVERDPFDRRADLLIFLDARRLAV